MVANGAEMNADLVPGAGGRKFRACKGDWRHAVGNRVAGRNDRRAMSYMFEGKQYIVVAVGSKEAGSAQFVALSLP